MRLDTRSGSAAAVAAARLVSLYAKLGRGADAQRHWNLAIRAFTRPDPVLLPRVEQARAALVTLH